MSSLVELLRYLRRTNASELHLAVGHVPRIRVEQEVIALEGWPILARDEFDGLMKSAPLPEPWRQFASGVVRQIAFPLELGGLPSLSVTALRTVLGPVALFRLAQEDHRGAGDELPAEVWERIASDGPGLVIASSGLRVARSALFDRFVAHLDRGPDRHVVFIDPPTDLSGGAYRFLKTELWTSGRDPGVAIGAARRLDADVVLVGELREGRAIEAAVRLAESGLKVIAMLQAESCVSAIDRVAAALPDRRWVEKLVAAITATLVRAPSGHRLAIEVLTRTPEMSAALRAGDSMAIDALLREGRDGMQTMDRALAELVRRGAVIYDEGAACARDRRRLDSILASFD